MKPPRLRTRLLHLLIDFLVIPIRIYAVLVVIWQDYLEPAATTVLAALRSLYPGSKGRKWTPTK